MEAKYVEGPCADDIVDFVGGNARLKTDDIFVVWDDGKVQLYPPQGLVGNLDLPTETIEGLPGYRLVMIERLGQRRTPAGDRFIYLGLFKGKSDSVIARFDMLNGKPSKDADIIIRSRSPIDSIGFLGAPDTPEGSIGFVQRVGTGKAWLYAYEWKHGDLAPLKF